MTPRQETITRCYSIPGQMWPSELGWLYDTFQSSRHHVEVGSYCGRSLMATCGAMEPGSTVYAVDNNSEGIDAGWVRSVRAATLSLIAQRIEVLEMESLAAARHLHGLGVKLDSVFIDACHEYAECGADIQAWRALVKPEGIIAGHDYWPVHNGVMAAVNELVPGFQIVPGTRIWWLRLE